MPTPFRLYFFFQPGCAACAAALPEFLKFQGKHSEGLYPQINMRIHSAKVAGFKPRVTPAYLLIPYGEERGISHEGALTAEDLEDFVYEVTQEPDDEDDPPKRLGAAPGTHEEEEE